MVLVISRDSLVSGGHGECRNIRRNMLQGGLFSSNNHAVLTESLHERGKKSKAKNNECAFSIFQRKMMCYKLSHSDSDLCLTGSLEVNAVFNNGDLELCDILYIPAQHPFLSGCHSSPQCAREY